MHATAKGFGLTLNFGPGKTEAVLALRGPSAKACKAHILESGGLLCDEFTLRVVPAYKHLGTLATYTAIPTRDAARRIQQANKAYAKMSGHFLGSARIPLETKMLAAGTLVDTVLLHGGELWTPLSAGIAQRVEHVHMRWLRRATAEIRSGTSPNLTDEEVRSIYQAASTSSLLACRRLRYLSSFDKACPFLRSLLQGSEGRHPWVAQIKEDIALLQAASPKLAGMPHPQLDVDSWVVFAIEHPAAWRKLLKAWACPYAPLAVDQPKAACPECGMTVRQQGLGAHQASKHNKIRVARFFCDASGKCPVCQGEFGTRLRCMHHVNYSTEGCLNELEAGLIEPLPEEIRIELDQQDAMVRKATTKAGVSYLAAFC